MGTAIGGWQSAGFQPAELASVREYTTFTGLASVNTDLPIPLQSLFSYIRPGYIHSGYNRDHGGTTEPERSRNVKLKRTCHPVFVLDLTRNDLLGVG